MHANPGPAAPTPEMSVVLTTMDVYESLRATIGHLRRQTARDRLEIVIVAPAAATLQIDEGELSVFWGFQTVRPDAIPSIGAANATAVRLARAPLVAIGEDHSFPEPDWAQALIEAHREGYAAVGPVIKNANPATLISWADLFLAYAPWLDPAPSGLRDHLPGHNSSYKREALLGYGPRLEEMMIAESVLHWDLRAKGQRLYLESRAKTRHTNFSRPSSWFRATFYSGRVFAASRSRHWSGTKRLLYAGASGVIPWVRLARIVRQAIDARQSPRLVLKVAPLLWLGLAVSALGEMMGYATGAGEAGRKLAPLEVQRTRHLSSRDRVK
ncbi:MAG: glycosyltransferase [Bryobacteraceae bacterium]|nr:glycosyltransferase [Bryobacteraceae bacterium]